MIISERDKRRANALKGAVEVWSRVTPDHSRPSIPVLEYLSGLSNVYKFEVQNILKGGL